MPSPISAVTFDLDGLMFNTEMIYGRVMRQLLEKRNKPFQQELLDQMMGRPGIIALGIFRDWHNLEETIEDIYADSDTIFLDILDRELAPMPGLVDLLNALEANNIPKAIATSSRAPVVYRMLDHFGWRPRFDFILTSGDVLVVECTDPLANLDIPNLVRETGDSLENTSQAEGVMMFSIRKR